MTDADNERSEERAFGYDAVAICMNCDRDLAQYRRFGVLNSRNLLYLQSELTSLETRLRELDSAANDFSRGNAVWSMPRSWHALERAQDEHLEVVMKIRERLDVYSKVPWHSLQNLQGRLSDEGVGMGGETTALLMAWLLGLKRPDRRPMENLEAYFKANPMNMAVSEAEFVSRKHREDLVALATAEKEPMFKVLEKGVYWLFGYKRSEVGGDNGHMTVYSNGKIRNFVRTLAVVGSSLLPILSIVGLYFVPSQAARLGCIVAFCFICSATLAALTNAKNVEIITATAAYAAVQVVFVSGTISDDS